MSDYPILQHRGHQYLKYVLENCVNDKSVDFFPLLGNRKGTFEYEARKFAINLSKNTSNEDETYNSIIGDITEALFEIYARLLISNFIGLRVLDHTSDDKYYRAFDFIGSAGINGTIPIKYQIKYRRDRKGKQHRFNYSELKTFFERADEENISPDYLFLVVISSTLIGKAVNDVFSFENKEEQRLMQDRCRVITGEMMRYKIIDAYSPEAELKNKHPLTLFYEHALAIIQESFKTVN